MADNASNRRNLAAPDPKTHMDPTHKKHPKPTPFITPSTASSAVLPQNQHRTTPSYPPHPTPDPTIIPPSTVQNISQRFSKLYSNHKKLVSKSLRPSNVYSHPQPDPDIQKRILTVSPVLDSSCTTTTLTKSKSHHERKDFGVAKDVEKEQFSGRTKVKEKDELKKMTKKESRIISSLKECDVKKASQLMARSLEIDQVKNFQEGFEVRRSSVSSVPIDNGGRRKSFCNSQVELADFFSCTGVKVVAVDMPPFMQIHAVNCARKTHDSLEKFTSKTLAFTLKKEFDGAYGPAWHCIVGTSFGSFVTHSVGGFMYFSMDHKIYILLFKTTVQKADSN